MLMLSNIYIPAPQDATMQVRSEVQECAITVGLLMFGIILERFVEVLRESINAVPPAVPHGESRKTAHG